MQLFLRKETVRKRSVALFSSVKDSASRNCARGLGWELKIRERKQGVSLSSPPLLLFASFSLVFASRSSGVYSIGRLSMTYRRQISCEQSLPRSSSQGRRQTANGKRQTANTKPSSNVKRQNANMKLLLSVFSCLNSRVKCDE